MSKLIHMKGIEGKVKRYSQKLHDKYDTPIRAKLKQILGEFISDNPDIHQQDFIINSNKCVYKYLEVQICCNWVNEYPYDNLFVYARKLKYGDDTVFLTVSKNLQYGYIFSIKDIRNVKPKRLKKYSREFVYNVPWDNALKVYIDSLDVLTFIMFSR